MDYAFREFLEFTPPEERAETERLLFAYDKHRKSTVTGYVWLFLLFPLGVHRFYLGLSRSALIVPALYLLAVVLFSLVHHLGAPKPFLILPIGMVLSIGALWVWDLAFLSNWVYEHNRALINRLNHEMLLEDPSTRTPRVDPGDDPGPAVEPHGMQDKAWHPNP